MATRDMTSFLVLVLCSTAVVLSLLHVAAAVKFTNCGSQRGELGRIEVSGCGSSARNEADEADESTCFFYRGRNASIDATWIPNVVSETVRVRVWGIIGGVQVPFRITPDEACGNYGPTCPVQPGTEYPLRISIPILSSYPKVGVRVRVRLDDEGRKPFFCQQFPVKIVDPEDGK